MIDKEKFNMSQTLNEFLDDDEDEDSHIYYDEKTGKYYVSYDGINLTELDVKDIQDLDNLSQEEIDEINDQINKEFDEREETGIDVDTIDIDDLFNDDVRSELENENTFSKMKERKQKKELEQRRQARQDRRNQRGGISLKTITNLKMDIEDLIAEQVKDTFGTSWTKLNKKYNSNTGTIIAPGKVKIPNKKIPRLNVYFDQSGSWLQSDVDKGFDVISVLDEYMEEGKLIVDVKYFADGVHDDASSARAEGGTSAGPLILEDIYDTDPDNVLIMTDSDFDGYSELPQYEDAFKKAKKVSVEGGVWMMFRYGRVSNWLVSHLHGDEETKYYTFN